MANTQSLPAVDPQLAGQGFCVGQQVTFSVQFSPNLPTQPIILSNQWGFEGTLINVSNLALPDDWTSSWVFAKNPDLLKSPITTNWWVSGGDPANKDANVPSKYQANCTEVLKFTNGANGDICNLSGVIGKFNMYRPQGRIYALTDGVNVTNLNNDTGSLYAGTLTKAGIIFSHTISYPTNFAGSPQWVQVLTSLGTDRRYKTIRNGFNGGTVYEIYELGDRPPFLDDNVDDDMDLDSYPYGFFDPNSGYPVDSPTEPLAAREAWHDVDGESYKMTMMFIPPGDGIPVSLRAVTWSWSGKANNHYGQFGFGLWDLVPSSGKINADPDSDTVAFPMWLSWASDSACRVSTNQQR